MMTVFVNDKLLNDAKSGFYPNDGRLSLGEKDFMQAVGVSAAEYNCYLNGRFLHVSHTTYKKFLVLASPRARHFKTLFKMIDINERRVEVS